MATIRNATNADIEAVLSFWRDATTEPSTTDDVESLALLLVHAPEAVLVAVDHTMIIGTLIAGWDGWRGTLYRLAVLPARRRSGIAVALVEAGERQLRALGAQRVHLIVASDQVPARSFWSAAGYVGTDQTRYVKVLTERD